MVYDFHETHPLLIFVLLIAGTSTLADALSGGLAGFISLGSSIHPEILSAFSGPNPPAPDQAVSIAPVDVGIAIHRAVIDHPEYRFCI